MTIHKTLSVVLLSALFVAPLGASAASSKPSCTLTVSSSRGETVIKNNDLTVLALEDEELTFEWESRNAKKATNYDGDSIDLSGDDSVDITEDESFEFTFENGSNEVICAAHVVVVEGSFDDDTLSTDDETPVITGFASGVKTVGLIIEDQRGKKVFEKKSMKVSTRSATLGEWTARVTKKLKEGEYTVILTGTKKVGLTEIVTDTLTIDADNSGNASDGTVSISPIPLLMGGSAAPGSSIPVAYIQVSNPGKSATSIKGFTLSENGSASDDVIIGFSVNDDQGGSRQTFGGKEGDTQFKNGSAFVPLVATIAPGQLRIFTIKAIMSTKSGSQSGKSLMIDTAGVTTNATTRGTFPIRGTTFILSR